MINNAKRRLSFVLEVDYAIQKTEEIHKHMLIQEKKEDVNLYPRVNQGGSKKFAFRKQLNRTSSIISSSTSSDGNQYFLARDLSIVKQPSEKEEQTRYE